MGVNIKTLRDRIRAQVVWQDLIRKKFRRDVSIAEILRYWGDDEATRAVVLYPRGSAAPRAYPEVASDGAARTPVLARRGRVGRREKGLSFSYTPWATPS